LAPIGEVHHTTDTKLRRELLSRFRRRRSWRTLGIARCEREAKLLASLNHPNIAHIYGVEEHALQY
jgi:serine/threonine-protein kinase